LTVLLLSADFQSNNPEMREDSLDIEDLVAIGAWPR
jgi:hypothetical protein